MTQAAVLNITHKYSECIRLDTEAINYARSEILVPCLVYCSFKQIVEFFFYKAYYQESNNEPTASYNKSDRPRVKIEDT
jgi:hypothetical protein